MRTKFQTQAGTVWQLGKRWLIQYVSYRKSFSVRLKGRLGVRGAWMLRPVTRWLNILVCLGIELLLFSPVYWYFR
jgi:hypothetical protein